MPSCALITCLSERAERGKEKKKRAYLRVFESQHSIGNIVGREQTAYTAGVHPVLSRRRRKEPRQKDAASQQTLTVFHRIVTSCIFFSYWQPAVWSCLHSQCVGGFRCSKRSGASFAGVYCRSPQRATWPRTVLVRNTVLRVHFASTWLVRVPISSVSAT